MSAPRARRAAWAGLMAAVALGAACRHASAKHGTGTSAAGTTATDTLRGIVSIVGAEPQTTVALTPAGGAPVVLRGSALPELRSAQNLDVTVFGSPAGTVSDGSMPRDASLFMADRFVVRAVQGAAAVDGILLRTESGFALQLADGARSALTGVPIALQQQVGARIYWVGALDGTPAAYGIIRPVRP